MRLESNPDAGKFRLPEGYEDLGWQMHHQHPNWPNVHACLDAKHKRREFDNSTYKFRCTNVITICDECKQVFHTDMSD